MASASSSLRHHRAVSTPLAAGMEANAVPQDPAPITATLGSPAVIGTLPASPHPLLRDVVACAVLGIDPHAHDLIRARVLEHLVRWLPSVIGGLAPDTARRAPADGQQQQDRDHHDDAGVHRRISGEAVVERADAGRPMDVSWAGAPIASGSAPA